MHLGESAAYYVNLASRSSCHLRLFQEWFLDDIYCFKLAHRFLSPSLHLISFYGKQKTGCWVVVIVEKEKKKKRGEGKIASSYFLFGVIKNLANFLDARWKKISSAIFHSSARRNSQRSQQRLYT